MSDQEKETIETSSSSSRNEEVMQDLVISRRTTDDDAKPSQETKPFLDYTKMLDIGQLELPTPSVIGSSFSDGGTGACAPLSRKTSSSSDGAVNELNKAASVLDSCNLHSGKLLVFQRYFHEPKLQFFVRPEGRRRHNAERQTEDHSNEENCSPTKNEKDDSLEQGSLEPLRPTLNQAGAVVGYPTRFGQQLTLTGRNEIVCEIMSDPEHSIGSASTIPIEEIYIPNYEELIKGTQNEKTEKCMYMRDLRVSPNEIASASSCDQTDSDSLSNVNISPPLENDPPVTEVAAPEHTRKRKPSVYQRPAELEKVEQCTSFETHKQTSRKCSLEIPANVSSMPKRKISDSALSKDSSASGSEGVQMPLSRESSVDLEAFMTTKRSNGGEVTSRSNDGSASTAESSPKPDITCPVSSACLGLELLCLEEVEQVDDVTPTAIRGFTTEAMELAETSHEVESSHETDPASGESKSIRNK